MRALSRLAWRSLITHRIRTVLSALAIALGVAMIVATGVVNSGVRAGWSSGENVMAWVGDMIDVVFTGVGAIILAAAGFLIYNALTMTVAQQRQQIGMLRSLGMSRGQVMRLIMLEASATGLLGVLFGLAAGPLFGWAILFWMERLGLEVGRGQASLASIVLGVTLGMGITWISALIPARRATRVSPLSALREYEPVGRVDAANRKRFPTIAGSLLLLALLVYLIVAPPGEWSGAHPPWEWIAWLGLWCVWLLGGLLVLPALVGSLVRLTRVLVVRSESATARLLVDNLERSPRRVALTVLAFAIGVTTTVGIGGLLGFSNGVLVTRTADRVLQQVGWYVYPFDRTSALAQLSELDAASLALDPAVVADVRETVTGRADLGEMYMIQVPELSSVAPGFPSIVESPQALMRPGGFQFNEGDWETALPIMESGCGLLLPPGVAAQHRAKIGDTLTVRGIHGPVECTLAGIGVGETVPMSIISLKARDDFVAAGQTPSTLIVYPHPGTEVETLETDLYALAERHGDDAWISRPEDELHAVLDTSDQLQALFNGLTLLAQVAAALGTINTTVIAVFERRRELGLLRAVGMTRRQVRAMIVGEAALLGLFGSVLGLVAGIGMGCIFGLAYGGISFGLIDLPLWSAVGGTVLPAIQSGWVGLLAAPLLAGGAALPAVRTVLRGSPVETLEGRISSSPRRSSHRQIRRPSGHQGLRFLALRSLQQHPLRTALTALAVALGVAMVLAGDVMGRTIVDYGEQVEHQQSTAGILGAQLEQWLGVVGMVLLGMAAFVVFNAFLMSITQRRRQIGVLRSLGLTRGQVRRLVLRESLWVGAAGTVLGLAIGPLAGWGLVMLMADLADVDAGGTMPSASTVALAVLLGLGTTALAALLPARRAMRVPPLEAVREGGLSDKTATREMPWFLVGVVLISVLALYLGLAPPATHMPAARGDAFSWHLALTVVLAILWLVALGLILPALIASLGRAVRVPLSRLWGAVGRLVADNLGRARGRVTLTIVTLALSVAVIVGITGSLTMFSQSLLHYYMSKEVPPRWALFSIGWSGELASWQTVSEIDLAQMGISDELYDKVEKAFGEQAEILSVHAAILPELDVIPGSMSFLFDPPIAQRMGVFDFYEGDWESALPIMERGCGVLIAPVLARRHGVWLYDHLTVPGLQGPVECTVAGLGQSANFGATIVSAEAADQFAVPDKPMGLFVQPKASVDVGAFGGHLQAFADEYDGLYLMDLAEADDFQATMVNGMLAILNGPLLLAIAAAALGVVNTTAMSVSERRQELGLLRAVGASRRQVRSVVLGEAALMGLLGGLLGLLAGAGVSAILVLVGDHSAWGVHDVSLGPLLVKVVRSAVINGLVGTFVAPFACAIAAWLPARSILRGTAIETMSQRRSLEAPGKQRTRRRAARGALGLLAWSSIARYQTHTALSAAAVALGVATTVAANVVSSAILASIRESPDAVKFMGGLLDQLETWLTLVGVGITLAVSFLLFNAFGMSVARRRRQIGALRSLGMTRRQVMQLMVVEALILGGLGTMVGLVTGPLLGRATIALIRTLVGQGLFAFEIESGLPDNLLLAALLGLAGALLAVLLPARRATRISPLVALRQETGPAAAETGLGRGWVALGLALCLGAHAVLFPPARWVGTERFPAPWDVVLTLVFVVLWVACIAGTIPALVGLLGRGLRWVLVRKGGATGRLVADNLRRGRARVTLTVLTLVIALSLIAGMTGFIEFTFQDLFMPRIVAAGDLGGWIVMAQDFVSGMEAYVGAEQLALSPQVIEAIDQTLGDRIEGLAWHFAVVPELSFFGSTYFTFVLDPHGVKRAGDVFFEFHQGSWETALPQMTEGCGVLVSPMVATRNSVSLSETLAVTGNDGPVDCVVAGIGSPYVGASIVGQPASAFFDPTGVIAYQVWPAPGEDRGAVESDLAALLDQMPDAQYRDLSDMADMQAQVADWVPRLLNALLLLAVVAAALGVVNTTAISVTERRQELGMLRVVGSTRRQVNRLVTGEAALMGLLGGSVGLVSGAGIVVLVVLVYGGNSWGVPNLDLWPAAWRALQPTLLNGLLGLAAAPLICTMAAWLPARSTLRGTAIEAMEPERHVTARRRTGLLVAGSIRMRLVVGTAVLLALVLAGLMGAVVHHERTYLEDQAVRLLQIMVEGQAAMIELALPPDAQTIELAVLQMGQVDANALLGLQAMLDDVSNQGLESFVIADRDGVAQLSLDPRAIGTLVDADLPAETVLRSEREDGLWRVHAISPVRNDEGTAIGSLQMTADLSALEAFVEETRRVLWGIGGGIAVLGVIVSWVVATPIVRTTRQLTDSAQQVAQGTFASVWRRRRWWHVLVERTPVRLRLTIALVLVMISLVVTLEAVTVPVERYHLERTLQQSLTGTVEWLGELLSEGLAQQEGGLPLPALSDMDGMLQTALDLDLGKLQALSERAQTEDVAYVALTDEAGIVQFSDQIALIGTEVNVIPDTEILEERWRDEEIWVVSTPLREGGDGKLVGNMRFGVRRVSIDRYLDESRTLFRLTGMIAALAGILLAQAIGSAVAAPLRHLAAGVERIGQGDLNVQFRVRTRDELATLAHAFNEMAAGLREREWLRDMFGRFVSREVAEAIRSGQVRLEGENRVVSVLFCDIRDFTLRSERHSPEEMVALLNDYLPVVVEAAQHHGGTVNKFGGDSTLIVYGAPHRLQESAYQAVLTALEVRSGLAQLNELLAQRGEPAIRIGVGINTGTVLAGAVGPEARQEYTVIGDTVNLASRIEALNKTYPHYDVLISGQTWEALGSRRGEFDLVDLGELQIRGKEAPVRVWAVVGRT